jgi:hypothetical protein
VLAISLKKETSGPLSLVRGEDRLQAVYSRRGLVEAGAPDVYLVPVRL